MLYTIQPGHSFLDSDGSIKSGGDSIDLSDDVAAAHRDKVTPQAAFDAADAVDADEPLARIDHFAGE